MPPGIQSSFIRERTERVDLYAARNGGQKFPIEIPAFIRFYSTGGEGVGEVSCVKQREVLSGASIYFFRDQAVTQILYTKSNLRQRVIWFIGFEI